jgi:hypothetical protein
VRWLKILAGLVVVLIALGIVAYLVVTSSAFFKGVILPRVGRALNASITVSDASIHPFSQIDLRDCIVQAAGQETLVSAPEILVRYHLWDIIGGNVHVDEIALVSPTVDLVEHADGSHNWDPILKALQAKPAAQQQQAAAPSAPKAAKPLQVDLGKLTVSDAEIRQTKNYAGGNHDVTEVTNLTVTLANVKNGQTAKLDWSAGFQVANNPPGGPAGALAAALKGSFSCAFGPDLKPGAASGDASFVISQASGALENFDGFSAGLKCDATPAEIKELALSFERAGAPLGELSVSGPLDTAKMEGKLEVTLRGIDQRLLNLAGAKSGIDFGTTTIDASSEIQLTDAGKAIAAAGKFNLNKVQLTRAGQTTPTLDLSASYDLTVDGKAQAATLRTLSVTGTQNGAQLLDAQLSSPMTLTWGSQTSNVGDAALNVTVTGLNLADWKPFLGGAASAGSVGLKLQVLSHQAGQEIAFDLNAEAANLAMQAGSNTISQAAVHVSAQGKLSQMKQAALSESQVQLSLQNQPALTASASGTYDLGSGAADLQVKLQAELARLFGALPQAGLQCSAGEAILDAHIVQAQKQQTITGKLALNQFDGQLGKNEFHNYSGKFDLDVALSPEQIQITQLKGSFSQDGNAGGELALSGTFKPGKKSADAHVQLSGLNENAVRPFLQPLLAGKTLTSVAISGDVTGQYDPQGGSSVKGNVQVSNLVVKDPQQEFPATPLAAGLQVDATLGKQTADIRQFQIALTPTARATNQVQFSGQVDLSDTNAIQGNLKLAANSLDLTPYYDLFVGGTNASTKVARAAPAPAAAPVSASASEEPAAVKLPLRNFTVAANIGQLYLHEMAITGFLATVKIDGSHVVVTPCQLALNGGPVSAMAEVDLGVPGYNYNLLFSTTNVPIAPLVNTFKAARAGQMGGTLTAAAQFKGAGFSGGSLKRNLTGQLDLGITNLNLSVVNIQSRLFKSLINVVAAIPEFVGSLSNPESALSSLAGNVIGQGGLMNDLKQAPIEVISVKVNAGNGQINLQQAHVQSSAFAADATGGITLNAILTNSTINIPVTVSLSQAIAKRLQLTSSSDANNAYVALPKFLTMSGTLGDPKPKINKLALAGTTVRSVGGALLNLTSTNSPARALLSTNSPVGGLLNQLFKGGK